MSKLQNNSSTGVETPHLEVTVLFFDCIGQYITFNQGVFCFCYFEDSLTQREWDNRSACPRQSPTELCHCNLHIF